MFDILSELNTGYKDNDDLLAINIHFDLTDNRETSRGISAIATASKKTVQLSTPICSTLSIHQFMDGVKECLRVC